MIELLVLILLCKRIARKAENNGRSKALHVIITVILWFGMEFAGAYIGVSAGLGYAAYLPAMLFAAFGGFISYVIACISSVDYTPRNYNTPRNNYPLVDYFPAADLQPIKHAQVTIARERSGLGQPDIWEFFLNGKNVSGVEDGSSITVPTGHRTNVLLARDINGALTPPFEFTVESGRHSKVVFREGRFVSAKTIGKMS